MPVGQISRSARVLQDPQLAGVDAGRRTGVLPHKHARLILTAMKILMVASEAAPFAKTGGLADVVGSLPAALKALGHEVAVLLPRYATVDLKNARPVYDSLPIWLPPQRYDTSLYLVERETPFYFLDYPPLYDRPGFYGEDGLDYPDRPAHLPPSPALRHIPFPGGTQNAFLFPGLPAALRPARLLWRRRSGLSRQSHSFRGPGASGAGVLPARMAAGYPALSRLAGRTGAGVSAHHLRERPHLPRHALAVHDSQRRIPRAFSGRRAGRHRAGRNRGVPSRRAGVLRQSLLPEGRAQLCRRAEHGQPDVRARDPDSGIWFRTGWRTAGAPPGAFRHFERRGLHGVESGDRSLDRGALFERRLERQTHLQAGPGERVWTAGGSHGCPLDRHRLPLHQPEGRRPGRGRRRRLGGRRLLYGCAGHGRAPIRGTLPGNRGSASFAHRRAHRIR